MAKYQMYMCRYSGILINTKLKMRIVIQLKLVDIYSTLWTAITVEAHQLT